MYATAVCAGPCEVGREADPRLIDVRDGTVIVGIDGSSDESPLVSMLGMESVGSDVSVGRICVMLASIEPIDESPRLDGSTIREDGSVVSMVTGGSKVPVRLPIPDTAGNRVVRDGRRAEIEARGFVASEIRLTMGLPSGPSLTARLAIRMTVLVPFRMIPVEGSPSPAVSVHTPSVKLNPVHPNKREHLLEQAR